MLGEIRDVVFQYDLYHREEHRGGKLETMHIRKQSPQSVPSLPENPVMSCSYLEVVHFEVEFTIVLTNRGEKV
jgi:hypothetical protein